MSFDIIGAFAVLLTPLGAMAAAVFALLMARIKRLENENSNMLSILLTSCSDSSEGTRKLAEAIAERGHRGQ